MPSLENLEQPLQNNTPTRLASRRHGRMTTEGRAWRTHSRAPRDAMPRRRRRPGMDGHHSRGYHHLELDGALDGVVDLELVGQVELLEGEREGRVGAADARDRRLEAEEAALLHGR